MSEHTEAAIRLLDLALEHRSQSYKTRGQHERAFYNSQAFDDLALAVNNCIAAIEKLERNDDTLKYP